MIWARTPLDRFFNMVGLDRTFKVNEKHRKTAYYLEYGFFGAIIYVLLEIGSLTECAF